MLKPLTEQQSEYVRFRVAGKTQQEAYALAYPKSTAKQAAREVSACRLEAKPNVKGALEAARRNKRDRAIEDGIITGLDVMRELAAIGFAKTTDYMRLEADGHGVIRVVLTPTSELSHEQCVALSAIRKTQSGIEVKTHDKLRALRMLGETLGMFDSGGGLRDMEDLQLLADMLNGHDDDSDD